MALVGPLRQFVYELPHSSGIVNRPISHILSRKIYIVRRLVYGRLLGCGSLAFGCTAPLMCRCNFNCRLLCGSSTFPTVLRHISFRISTLTGLFSTLIAE